MVFAHAVELLNIEQFVHGNKAHYMIIEDTGLGLIQPWWRCDWRTIGSLVRHAAL